MDYTATYNAFWQCPENIGKHSFADTNRLAKKILSSCGRGKTLDAGCGEGLLVRTLLAQGVNCYGVDCSEIVLAHCSALAPGRFRTANILALPFPNNSFETVVSANVLEHIAPEDVPLALAELRRVCARNVFLQICAQPEREQRWFLTVRDRGWWEKACLTAGFRFHARELYCEPYENRDYERDPCVIILEKIPDAILAAYPLACLEAGRTLHMDMLRDSGRRGEAHRMRYYAAADEIRNRDIVLDIACGLGYGSHILYQNSQASRIIGVDNSEFAIAYATANYGMGEAISFQRGNAQDISFLPDNSVDYIASFETIEHLENPAAYLRELHRVLRPSGRVMISAPNNWVDETGTDPNPHHLHVYTWKRLRGELSLHFLPEKAFAQNAGPNTSRTATRRWEEYSAHQMDPADAEWAILQATKDPLQNAHVPYVERRPIPAGWRFHDHEMEKNYRNPWLYDGLLSGNLRTHNPQALQHIAETAQETNPQDSTDYALALCVLAYRQLEKPEAIMPEGLLHSIEQWLKTPHDDSPIHRRWQTSLLYVLGLLWQQQGDFSRAEQCFTLCADQDPLSVIPTLGTKTIGAHYLKAQLLLARGEMQEARALLQKALKKTWQLFGHGGIEVVGSLDAPLWWPLQEMRDILAIAQECLVLLHELPTAHMRPGKTHCASPLYEHLAFEPKNVMYEKSLQRHARCLENTPVFFWGCGQMYALRKSIFAKCKPLAILLDYNPENIKEKDGLPVVHPYDVLRKDKTIPIIIFSWNPMPMVQTIERDFPYYTAQDIIICNSL